MIFYFSGTGNSRHVAQRISQALDIPMYAMDTLLQQEHMHFELSPGERVGFVFPTHFWGVPSLVCRFLEQLQLTCATRPVTTSYFFVVTTYGTSIGGVLKQTRKILEQRGWKLNGQFSVRMVDVWTPMFDLTHTARNRRKTLQAEPVIGRVVEAIGQYGSGRSGLTALPMWIAGLSYRLYDGMRRTHHFRVMAERCIGCGRCAKHCPTQTIVLNEEGYPVWEKEQCTLCLRCLHSCPAFAIQYGKHTERHGQFLYPLSLE